MAISLIYLNFRFLKEPSIYDRLNLVLPVDNYISYCKMYGHDGWHDSFYNRAGLNTLDWHDTVSTVMNYRVPEFDNSFDKSFAEVTDQRCMDLMAKRSDKPWAILWSGGIDSTVMVCSLLKNLTDSEKQSVTILCDINSITENPGFFQTQIRPNFRVDSFGKVLGYYDNHLVMGGEMGDCLFAHKHAGLLKRIGLADQPWKNHTDAMIEFISTTGNTTVDLARWVWERLIPNVQSVDVPVESCVDLLWWMMFNWHWIPTTMRFQRRTNLSMKVWKDRHVHWFDDTAYQQWAMHNNNTGEKNGPELWQQKIAAKSYIHALDQDHYYFRHKLKVNSGGRKENRIKDWVGLDADLVEYHARDLENLRESIMAHRRPPGL